MINAFTVDVEDYFHVQSFADRIDPKDWDGYPSRVVANTRRLLRMLDEYHVRGTFFVLGWVADRYPHLIREIQDAGHEIGCHGFYHGLLYRMTPEEFREDLVMGTKAIEEVTGEQVKAFRAPSFSITQRSLWALDILIEEGFQYDSSIFPIYHDNYGIPGAERFPHIIRRTNGTPPPANPRNNQTAAHPSTPIPQRSTLNAQPSTISHQPSTDTAPTLYEFPPTVYRRWGLNIPVAGGGYFRLYPFFLTRSWLGRINTVERQPFVFYIHPWELDPDQPRLPARWKSRFRHYQNLRRTEGKLRRLLSTFRFGTLSESLRHAGLGADGHRSAPAPAAWR